MESLQEIVCKNFNRLVDSSDMSKRELARLLTVSEATIQRWGASKKKGGNPPTIDNIQAIADLLKVSPLEFYKTDQAPPPLTMPVSHTLQKLMVIPDYVYDAVDGILLDDDVWEVIEGLLREASRQARDSKSSANDA